MTNKTSLFYYFLGFGTLTLGLLYLQSEIDYYAIIFTLLGIFLINAAYTLDNTITLFNIIKKELEELTK